MLLFHGLLLQLQLQNNEVILLGGLRAASSGLFQRFLWYATVPLEWNKGMFCPIYKQEGSVLDIATWKLAKREYMQINTFRERERERESYSAQVYYTTTTSTIRSKRQLPRDATALPSAFAPVVLLVLELNLPVHKPSHQRL